MRQTNHKPSFSQRSGEPGWYHAYFVAMCESNRHQAFLEIEHARHEIQERLGELSHQPGCELREIQDLNSALTYLGILTMQMGKESGNLLWD